MLPEVSFGMTTPTDSLDGSYDWTSVPAGNLFFIIVTLERKSRGERISLTGFKMKEEEQPQATFAVIRSIVMMEFANNQVI